jgi:GR25 family glycosyltransferase involved in LPS biosynthesis/cephalosporin hydroxylase
MSETLHQEILGKLWRGYNPYYGFPYKTVKPDLQGWASQHRFLADTVAARRPKIIVEVGVWKGGSVIELAQSVRSNGLDAVVIAVDTWLGSWDLWADDRWHADLGFVFGFPTVYRTFLANVMTAGLHGVVIPLPLDSVNAQHTLERLRIFPDLVHIDGAHDFNTVLSDLTHWWNLLTVGGTMIMDDYFDSIQDWPDVFRAVQTFLKRVQYTAFEAEQPKCRFVKAADEEHGTGVRFRLDAGNLIGNGDAAVAAGSGTLEGCATQIPTSSLGTNSLAHNDKPSVLPPIHLINLDRSTARLQRFSERNGHLENVIRVSATDGATLDREALMRAGYMDREVPYAAGQLGNAISHIRLWERAVAQNRSITIFEDDIIVTRQFEKRAEEVLRILPADWDIVQWGYILGPSFVWVDLGISKVRLHCYGPRNDVAKFQAEPLPAGPVRLLHADGTQCYSISAKGARAALESCLPIRRRLIHYPDAGVTIENKAIDNALCGLYPMVKAFICLPSLVIHYDEGESISKAIDQEQKV